MNNLTTIPTKDKTALQTMNIQKICGVDCYEKDGTAYLKLESVARGLGFTHKEIKNGKEYESIRWAVVRTYLDDLGFRQQAGENSPQVGKDDFIPENIFYRLAMKAKNETAEKFQALVADEIIPSIRKNGGYIANQNNMTPAEIVAHALIVANNIIEEKTKELELVQKKNAELLDDNQRMKPKEIFADAVSASDSSMLVRDVAKIIKQNGVSLGEKRFYKWLRDNGYICQGSTSPTQKAMELGLFEIVVRTIERGNGLPIETKTTKVTGKGQQYFINKFLNAEGKSA